MMKSEHNSEKSDLKTQEASESVSLKISANPFESSLSKIKHLISAICAIDVSIPVMWYDNENYARGAMSRIEIDSNLGVRLKFDENASHVPMEGAPVLLRTHLFLTPITALVSKINEDENFEKPVKEISKEVESGSKNIVYIDEIQFLKVKNNIRKYPRFMLKKPMEIQMMIGNIVYTCEMLDISKDGIGFRISSERNLSGSVGKRMFIQFTYRNELIKLNGNIAWINRSNMSEYLGGALLYPSLKETDILTDIIFNNIYEAEQDLLKLVFSCDGDSN